VLFYDGDVPASLPNFMALLPASASTRVQTCLNTQPLFPTAKAAKRLYDLGAREVHTLYYGADEDLFSPLDVPQDSMLLLWARA